ncbi:MAG: helix-turn-helix transcriptional regulator [Terriglobia bacterium]|jgi:transcriptional regulator GlxA family with amidase domain
MAGLWGGAGPFPKPAAVDPRISQVTALMHRAMHRKLPLRELAGATGLSVSRLCHLFKSHIGLGPARYLKLLRMRRAKELLETSVLSVKEIGVRLGYDDPSRFVEDFGKACGQTPLRHRHSTGRKPGPAQTEN